MPPSTSPARTTATPRRWTTDSSTPSGAWSVTLAATASVAGLLLGWWCRWAVGTGVGTADRAVAVLAEMGSPWVVTAFATGAVGAAVAPRGRRGARAVAAAGAAAGALALVVATVAYYRVPLGLVVTHPDLAYERAWLLAGTLVGACSGGLGATWAHRHGTPPARWAAIGLGSVVSGEAVSALARGGALTALDRGSLDAATTRLHLGLVAAGLVVAATAVPAGRERARAIAATAALAGPTALVVARCYALVV